VLVHGADGKEGSDGGPDWERGRLARLHPWPGGKALTPGSNVGLGLAQTDDTVALFPLGALLEDGDAFESF
jgi:hypothetical protein